MTRLRVLELLQNGEKSATVLQEQIVIGQSTLSHHMKILVESGIVTARKAGKWTYYSICEKGGLYAAGLLRLLTSKDKARAARNVKPNIKDQRRKNMMKPFSIVVDTSCDLPPDYLKEHGIEVIPIPFTLDDVQHNSGGWQEISGKDFYNALRNGGIAKTTQINPDAFIGSFTEYAKQGRDALFILLSGGLSGTYQSSMIALNEVRDSYPDCNIYPVDGMCATALNGLLAMIAVQKREEGYSAEETAALLEEKRHSIFGLFTVDDLMYLHRGGRLSKLSAIGGSLLGIKPVLNMQPDGTLALKDKVRGRTAAFKLMVNQLKQSVSSDRELDTVFITHTDCGDDAQKLAEMVKAAVNVRRVVVILMCPVIGAHVGPGTVTLIFEASITRSEFEANHAAGKK
ncbi:MAG: metalloregulator ArsR/SmtB family transcription factor [Defluviitaleaceae bacterium]|nr:metalloregulator ArsR/SmtB family transcription factor [Defluviitaleaceae bacterium]MCL2836375.1 metalloregulator ArsR/SmtB family transcription factor [Defluviitaleaceae bacterium]